MHRNLLPFLEHVVQDSAVSPQRPFLPLIPQFVAELDSSFRAARELWRSSDDSDLEAYASALS
ncbi:hypothetical protein CRG98_014470 [Punica granatum]|uniref:Uncharacterized protein n=1 Tax=Punica granatum TaxID=22663 RepID=A0A2I0KBK1_PUNGR|nr:hypothetical protein CRG98_014470 [Punica granatum]